MLKSNEKTVCNDGTIVTNIQVIEETIKIIQID